MWFPKGHLTWKNYFIHSGIDNAQILGERKNLREYGEEWSKNCNIVLNVEFSLWVYFKGIYVHFNILNKDVQSKQVQIDYSSGF